MARRKATNGRDPGGGDSAATGDLLLRYIERAERLAEEMQALRDDMKEVFAQAKAAGFDVRTMRSIIRERALSAEERAEREALLQSYRAALGMLGDTPLGEAARARFERAMGGPPARAAPAV
jgi:uncharacterized protein (UPF0335 family)